MTAGRPPRWLLDGMPPGLFIDALEPDGRGRLSFPPLARHGLSWFKAGADVLGVLEERGRVRLVDYGAASSVKRRLVELTGLLELREATAATSILGLQDRYRRLSMDSEARMLLPLAVAVHLDAHAAVPGTVMFVARYPEHVELWGRSYRERHLDQARSESFDLP